MTDKSETVLTPEQFQLPLSLSREVDRLCDEFEGRWRAGETPDPEAFLGRCAGEARHVLRDELTALRQELTEGARSTIGPAAGESGAAPATGPAEPSGPAEGPADRFGEYDLLKSLGQGGMGSVWLARHRLLGKTVALKMVRADRISPAALARFRREIRAVGQLKHTHLIEAYSAGEQDGTLYLAMEYLPGQSLDQVVRERGPLAAAEACALARSIALGLQHLHEQGLVHRDLKPANVMLTPDGVVKVLDLGLVHVETRADALTGSGVVMGTLDYLAPEQAEDAAHVTPAADLYSLGCTLFHLLAGRPPFHRADSTMSKLLAHKLEPPPDPGQVRPDLAHELTGLVRQLLAKDPSARPASAAAVADALGRMAIPAGSPGESRPGPAAPSRARVPADHPRRVRVSRRAVVASLAGLAAVLALVAVLAWLRPAPRIESFRVGLYARTETDRAKVAWSGALADDVYEAAFDNVVRLSVEVSEPCYLYVRAYNPDGKDQPCWPADDAVAPPPTARCLDFPPDSDSYFPLNDEPRGGVQAFVVVASREPLPPFGQWPGRQGLSWERIEASQERAVAWQGDGRWLNELPTGQPRGQEEKLGGISTLTRLGERLRGTPGVDDVRVLAFPVRPQLKR